MLQQVQDFVDAGAQHIVVMSTDAVDSLKSAERFTHDVIPEFGPDTSIAARRGSSTPSPRHPTSRRLAPSVISVPWRTRSPTLRPR
jgi:hypothetical protein